MQAAPRVVFLAESERRVKELQQAGLHFVGISVSSGETGALWRPSLMPGTSTVARESVTPIFRAIAAKILTRLDEDVGRMLGRKLRNDQA